MKVVVVCGMVRYFITGKVHIYICDVQFTGEVLLVPYTYSFISMKIAPKATAEATAVCNCTKVSYSLEVVKTIKFCQISLSAASLLVTS